MLRWRSVFYFSPVLSGTKYALKQTRGKYGLGAKMVGFNLFSIYFCLFFDLREWCVGVIRG